MQETITTVETANIFSTPKVSSLCPFLSAPPLLSITLVYFALKFFVQM